MKDKLLLITYLFLVCGVYASSDITVKVSGNAGNIDSVALNNDYVRVMRNSTVESASDSEIFGTRVLVALTQLKVTGTKTKKTLNRGEIAVFQPKESCKISEGEYFEVAFKKNHPSLKGPDEWLEPVKNTVVYEDEQFRVFEERLAPGDTRELHSHAQRVVVRLNEVQLTDPRTRPNGTPSGGIQVPNTVKFAEPVVHVVKNLSKDTPLFNIVLEFKVPTPSQGK
jgi:hypothetical protein